MRCPRLYSRGLSLYSSLYLLRCRLVKQHMVTEEDAFVKSFAFSSLQRANIQSLCQSEDAVSFSDSRQGQALLTRYKQMNQRVHRRLAVNILNRSLLLVPSTQ